VADLPDGYTLLHRNARLNDEETRRLIAALRTMDADD
jgi:hypothetical protein